jgi:hypothetical protein
MPRIPRELKVLLGAGASICLFFLVSCLYTLIFTMPKLDQVFMDGHAVTSANALGLARAFRNLLKVFAFFTGIGAGFCGVLILLLRKHLTRP